MYLVRALQDGQLVAGKYGVRPAVALQRLADTLTAGDLDKLQDEYEFTGVSSEDWDEARQGVWST